MLVPAMQSIGTRYFSSTLSTPMCAAPRAPPPESTRQIFGRLAGAAPAGESGGVAAWALATSRVASNSPAPAIVLPSGFRMSKFSS